MPISQPTHSIQLCFEEVLDRKPVGQCLSGVTQDPLGNLWLVSDESACIERLKPTGKGRYGEHKRYHLDDYFSLPGQIGDEIDLESITFDDGYLWVVGSHARRFPSHEFGHELRAERAKRDPRRCLLGRIPLVDGEPTKLGSDGRLAAMLEIHGRSNRLIEELKEDPYISPYLQLPSKANGLDIEGLAVRGNRILLGLRGPVLLNQAILLEILLKPSKRDPSLLRLQKLDRFRYRRHFLNLDGLGIRSLQFHQDDLLILAGPTMSCEGPYRIYVLPDSDLGSGKAHEIFEIPSHREGDNAEGIVPVDGGVLVVYDRPIPARVDHAKVKADIFSL